LLLFKKPDVLGAMKPAGNRKPLALDIRRDDVPDCHFYQGI